MEIPYTVEARPDTGLNNGKIGIWLFLASEVMLFGALFASYIMLRVGRRAVAARLHSILNVPARHAQHGGAHHLERHHGAWPGRRSMRNHSASSGCSWASRCCCGFGFLVIKYFEYSAKFHHHLLPRTNTFLAIYFTLTGLHGLHVIGGMAVNAYLWGPGAKLWKTDPCTSPTGSRTPACSGTSSTWSGSSCSHPLPALGDDDGEPTPWPTHADIDRHVRGLHLVFVSLMALTPSRWRSPTCTCRSGRHRARPLRRHHQGLAGGAYFMHLISERKLIYWVLAFTVVCFFWPAADPSGPLCTDPDKLQLSHDPARLPRRLHRRLDPAGVRCSASGAAAVPDSRRGRLLAGARRPSRWALGLMSTRPGSCVIRGTMSAVIRNARRRSAAVAELALGAAAPAAACESATARPRVR